MDFVCGYFLGFSLVIGGTGLKVPKSLSQFGTVLVIYHEIFGVCRETNGFFFGDIC